jgi:hypothetical protein
MKKGYLGLLLTPLLVAGCDTLWQSSIQPGSSCTVQTGLCSQGQVCNFTTGMCEDLQPGWTVASIDAQSPGTVYTCSQQQANPSGPALTVQISGPVSLAGATVQVNDVMVQATDIVPVSDKVIQVTLPAYFQPGQVKFTVTPMGGSPVPLSTVIQYSDAVPFATVLVPTSTANTNTTVTTALTAVNQIASFRPQVGTPLALAVLGGDASSPQLAYYLDSTNRRLPIYANQATPIPVFGLNLALAQTLSIQPAGQTALKNLVVGAAVQPGTGPAMSEIDLFNNGNASPTVRAGAGLTQSTVPITAQVVATGRFGAVGDSAQVLALVGQHQSKTITLEYYPAPFTGTAPSVQATVLDASQVAGVTDVAPAALAAADLNQDGFSDAIAVLSRTIGSSPAWEVHALLGGNITTSIIQLPIPFSSPTTLALDDLDGDQVPDAVFGTPGSLSIYYNKTQAKTNGVSLYPGASFQISGLRSFAIVDYNGDGANDIVYSAGSNSTGAIYVLLNSPGGSIGSGTMPIMIYNGKAMGGPTNPDKIAISEFAGDSRPDLVVSEPPAAGAMYAKVYYLENSCTAAP